jgi:uncharacterized protein (DUF1778 family)
VAERHSPATAKGSINLRIEANTRQLIDEAAAILGKTRTEFMVESARRQAIDVLLNRRLVMLDPEYYDAFTRALDNPPAPGAKLRSLLRRVPAWQRWKASPRAPIFVRKALIRDCLAASDVVVNNK